VLSLFRIPQPSPPDFYSPVMRVNRPACPFGSKIHRQRIRPNSKVQANGDDKDHSLFHKCQGLSKVMSFWGESAFGWRRQSSLCGKMLIVSLTLCSYKGRKNLRRGVLEALRLFTNVCTRADWLPQKPLDYSILVPRSLTSPPQCSA
jgi:hypothetical protein